ncbi:MAG: hypothetical protein VCA36_10110 [Opitutales bacterium]
MKLLTVFISLCIAILSAEADDTVHEWINLEGKKISAKYIKSDELPVTIVMNGKQFDYPLSKLTPESQALAKKLAAAGKPDAVEVDPFGSPPPTPAKPGNPGNPGVVPQPGIIPKPGVVPNPGVAPKPAAIDPLKVGGKTLLPTIGEGKWARYYAVAEGRNFDVAVHGSGHLYFFLKDTAGEVIGKPLRLSFRVGYYTQKDPSKGWPHAYYRDNPNSHYKLRKLVSFEMPKAPPSASGFRRLELVGNYDDAVKLTMGFEVSGNRIAITGEPEDPRKIEHASVMAIDVKVPPFVEIPDNWRAPDWTPVIGDTTISAVSPKGGRAVDLSYLEKWDDLKKMTGIWRDIREAELHGKLFGKRKVSLASKSFRDLRFMLMHYGAVFPFQAYHFVYEDSRTGGEIDRGRRLEIEIR